MVEEAWESSGRRYAEIQGREAGRVSSRTDSYIRRYTGPPNGDPVDVVRSYHRAVAVGDSKTAYGFLAQSLRAKTPFDEFQKDIGVFGGVPYNVREIKRRPGGWDTVVVDVEINLSIDGEERRVSGSHVVKSSNSNWVISSSKIGSVRRTGASLDKHIEENLKRAKAGDLDAKIALSRAYQYKKGKGADHLKWTIEAAEGGHVDSMLLAGIECMAASLSSKKMPSEIRSKFHENGLHYLRMAKRNGSREADELLDSYSREQSPRSIRW